MAKKSRNRQQKSAEATTEGVSNEQIPCCCNSFGGHNCWTEAPASETRTCHNDCQTLEFCRLSSMHGLKYIGQVRGNFLERVLWSIFFLAAIGASVYLLKDILIKYIYSPVTITFAEEATQIDSIPFPAVTICNVNNVRKTKVLELLDILRYGEERGLPDAEIEQSVEDLSILQHVCDTTSTSFSSKFAQFVASKSALATELHDIEQELKNRTKPSGKYPDVTSLLQRIAQPCPEMIKLCMWQNKPENEPGVNCTHLFREVITDFGKCCTFNMAPESLLSYTPRTERRYDDLRKKWEQGQYDTDNLFLNQKRLNNLLKDHPDLQKKIPEYPKRVRSSGVSNGISIVVDPDLDDYFCVASDSGGFQVAVHLPIEFPRIADYGDAVPHNAETFLKVRPDVTKAERGIRHLAVDIRRCFFAGEFSLKYFKIYTRQNCRDECIANDTNKFCHCGRFFMPRDPERKLCTHDDLTCTLQIDQADDACSECLETCNDINYKADATSRPIRNDTKMWLQKAANTTYSWNKRNLGLIHVYFDEDLFAPKTRQLLFGFSDLLAQIGNVLGLTIGFSALAFFELLYFTLKKIITCILRISRNCFRWFDEECWAYCEEPNSQGRGQVREQRRNSTVIYAHAMPLPTSRALRTLPNPQSHSSIVLHSSDDFVGRNRNYY